MLDLKLIQRMKDLLVITIQNTIAQLGILPDEYGVGVKSVLGSYDELAVMSLGCYLEECQRQGNYSSLKKGLADIQKVIANNVKSSST